MKKIMFLRRLAAVLTLYPTTFVHFGVGAQQKPEVAAAACQVEEINYMGWQAQQVSNPWVKLIFVPQNGGRLMQVIFDGHPYLFVNPRYAGKHLPPSNSEWFNYASCGCSRREARTSSTGQAILICWMMVCLSSKFSRQGNAAKFP